MTERREDLPGGWLWTLIMASAWSCSSAHEQMSHVDAQTTATAIDASAEVTGDFSSAPYDHRPVAVTCTPAKPPSPLPGDGSCRSHDDCTRRRFGRCTQYGCFYDDCRTDGDCNADQICICWDHPQLGYNVSRCAHASCKSDADCREGLCRPSGSACDGVFIMGYFCEKTADECARDDDCDERSYCWYDAALEHRRCREREGCTVP